MEEEIEAIFLDTNVFERAKFEYENNNFSKLLELCEDHEIPIYIDYIVDQEVLHRISENVKSTAEGLRKEKLYYLSKVCDIPTDVNEISKRLLEKLVDDYTMIKSQYLRILDNNIKAIEVAELYFKNEVPFAQGIKKHEFPDAIIGANIKKFVADSGIKMLTVSHDTGLRTFLDNNFLQAVSMVSHAVNAINKQFQTDTYFSEIKANLMLKIKEYILEGSIGLNLYTYDYEDAVYADDYHITEAKIQDVLLIDRDNSQGVLTVTCPCVITIEVTTDYYPDYENGMLDKEDHNWYCFSNKKTTHLLQREIEPTFELSGIEQKGKTLDVYYTDSDIDIEFDLYSTTIIHEEYSDETGRNYLYD